MLIVSKAGMTRYLLDPRLEQNSREFGVGPGWLGGGFGYLAALLEADPAVDSPRIRDLRTRLDGRPLLDDSVWHRVFDWLTRTAVPRRDGDVALFHVGVSFDKSVTLFVLLHPDEPRRRLVQDIAAAVGRRVEAMLDRQAVRSGADGRHRVPSRGFGIGFVEGVGAYGQPQFHFHFGVANTSVTPDGRFGAVGNPRDTLYRATPEANALIQADVAAVLRAHGARTEPAPDGVHVRVTGFPPLLVESQSPARAELLARAADAGPVPSGLRARDLRAFEAHRAALDRHPDAYAKGAGAVHREVIAECRRHGVTLDRVRTDAEPWPAPPDDREERWLAGDAVTAAVRALAGRGGTVSAGEFRAAVINQGLALPRPVSGDALRAAAVEAERRPERHGLRRVTRGTEVFWTTPAAGPAYVRATHGFCRADVLARSADAQPAGEAGRPAAEADRPATSGRPSAGTARRAAVDRADDRLRVAVADLTTAVRVVLTVTAARVVEGLAAAVRGRPTRVVIDGRDINRFVARHTPGTYWAAQAAAWKAILTTPGGHLARGAAGEAAFLRVRRHTRLPRRAEVIVTHGHAVSTPQLDALLAVAVRDGARAVTVSDRPAFDALAGRGQRLPRRPADRRLGNEPTRSPRAESPPAGRPPASQSAEGRRSEARGRDREIGL